LACVRSPPTIPTINPIIAAVCAPAMPPAGRGVALVHRPLHRCLFEDRAAGACCTAAVGGVAAHLTDAGIGSISEILDAEDPHARGGCIAQAWSVAEVLRAWLKTRTL
jgi:hypothetical protein